MSWALDESGGPDLLSDSEQQEERRHRAGRVRWRGFDANAWAKHGREAESRRTGWRARLRDASTGLLRSRWKPRPSCLRALEIVRLQGFIVHGDSLSGPFLIAGIGSARWSPPLPAATRCVQRCRGQCLQPWRSHALISRSGAATPRASARAQVCMGLGALARFWHRLI